MVGGHMSEQAVKQLGQTPKIVTGHLTYPQNGTGPVRFSAMLR